MTYKMAIIGYGGMGAWHQRNVDERIQGVSVKGIYDIQESAQQKASDNGFIVYQSLEELLADPEIMLVTIAVPNNFHKEYAIKALEAGKHVVCEKPVTMNAIELEEIIAVANETKKLFSIHQNRRWDKDFRIVKKIQEDNLLGEIYFIESRVQGSGRMLHGWRGHAQNGGGMLYDWGVHLLDQLLWLDSSPVVSVSVQLAHVYYQEVDDNFKVFLTFMNGRSALVEVSTNCFINQPRWHISGKDGTAIIQDWDCNGEMVTVVGENKLTWEDDIVYTAAGPTRTMAPRPEETKKKMPLPEVDTDWSLYYKNIIAVIEGKEELIVKPEEALRVMRLIDIIFECAHTGKPVSCKI